LAWHSNHPATLRRTPKSEPTVMVVTLAVVVAIHDLAIAIGVWSRWPCSPAASPT